MDQVKQVLAVLNVHKFWVTCGFLALLPVGIWFMAKSSLDKERAARTSEIESAFSTAKSVSSITNHPNTISAEGMDANLGLLKKSVFEAWQAQYEEQKQILVWPTELRDDFIAKVDPLRPIEEKVAYPPQPQDELRLEYREEYRDYIKDELPKLAKIIGANWTASGGGPASTGPNFGGTQMGPTARSKPMTDGSIVKWDSSDQSRLISQFDWSGTRDKLPQTLDILYAQEDLWILTAVMNIIKRTNRDATAGYDATIKELKYVQLGKAVRGAVGQVSRLTGSAATGGGDMYGGEGMEDMMAGMDSTEAMSNEDSESEYTATAVGPDPANMRYVDNDYVPLPADRVRTALSPDGKSPDDAFLVVAKRIPIRLGLTMDQRRIHRLVTECGNSTLMVEVRQVRVNRQTAPSGGGMGYGGGGDEGGMGMGGGFGGGGFGGGGFGEGEDEGADEGMMGMGESFGGGQSTADSMKSSYDLPVELYGVIYIYNPVAEKKLGIELKEADPNATPAADEPVAVDQNNTPPATDTAMATN